jgi:predicted RNA-binding protein
MGFGSLHYTSDSDKRKGSTNLESFFDKSFINSVYNNHFANLTKSLFLFSNLENNTISSNDFINSLLIDFGSFAFVNDKDYGLIATAYTPYENKYDLNGRPTKIRAEVPPNVDTVLNEREYSSEDFVIVKLNPMGTALRNTIMYFTQKITENQRAIDQNVFSCQTPVIYECVDGQQKTLTDIFESMTKMVRAIFLKRDRGARAEDIIKVLPTPEFKGDKFINNIQYYEGELYNFCGFKHTPYEKKERLLSGEVESNNEILNTTKAMMYRSVQAGIKEVNEKFNKDIKVEFVLTNYNENFDKIPLRTTEASSGNESDIIEEGEIEDVK